MSKFHKAYETYWDDQFKRHTVNILPGEYHATQGEEMMVTVLGSCVAACIRDKNSGIGGMNHFLLPSRKYLKQSKPCPTNYDNPETRYGDLAMEMLINDIIRRGGQRHYLEAKIFGGAQMYQARANIGKRNIEFVKAYLKIESIPLCSQDVAGNYGRKVIYIPSTGEIFLKRINSIHSKTIKQRETEYLSAAKKQQMEADIEFF